MRISVKEAKKIVTIVIGATQSTVGILAFIAAYILHSDFFGLRVGSKMPELLPLYVLVLIVFGFFSIISGLFLLSEREESL